MTSGTDSTTNSDTSSTMDLRGEEDMQQTGQVQFHNGSEDGFWRNEAHEVCEHCLVGLANTIKLLISGIEMVYCCKAYNRASLEIDNDPDLFRIVRD